MAKITMAGRTNFQRLIKKMKLTLTAMTLTAIMFAGSASAFDPDDLQKLKNNNACKSCDLSGADLTGTDLGSAIVMDIILCNTTMLDGSVNDSGG